MKTMTHSVGHSILDLMFSLISTLPLTVAWQAGSERSHCLFLT